MRTDFDLRIPCLELDKGDGAIRVKGRIDDTRIRMRGLRIEMKNVGHVTLTAGAGYLAYGVEGRYGTFDLIAPDIAATAHAQLELSIHRGFGFGGTLPGWFHQTFNLDSPDDPNDPDDLEQGWHDLYAHELSDSLRPSKLSLCPQVVRWVPGVCSYGISTSPGLMRIRKNSVHFDGVSDGLTDTRNVFTFIDPGSNNIFKAFLEPATVLLSTPPGFERQVCIRIAGIDWPCYNP